MNNNMNEIHDGSARAQVVFLLLRHSVFGQLPYDVFRLIFEPLGLAPGGGSASRQEVEGLLPMWEHPALQPPRNGCCLFMELPAELRRDIFSYELAARDVIFTPTCGTEDHKVEKLDKDGKPLPVRRNRASDLMVINKQICSEIATVLYEERTFEIHCHEGLRHGGIEVLDAGRQKLQYREEIFEDTRFARFLHGENVSILMGATLEGDRDMPSCTAAVSYTHLTLPTKRIV